MKWRTGSYYHKGNSSWFDSECTDEEYMVNFSGRYRELHGVTVRTDTPEHFMDDLKKYGYITG